MIKQHLSGSWRFLKDRRAKLASRYVITEPAPLSVRFSAGILDLGIVLIIGIILSLIWHVFQGDVSLEPRRPRYRPPTPADAGWRMAKSLAVYLALCAYYAGWISSRFRATPGMMALRSHVGVYRADINFPARHYAGKDDQPPLSFFHAFSWVFMAFLPLLAANILVLAGVFWQESLLHLGRLNIFSLIILCQVMWFIVMILAADKRGIHDMATGIHVLHETRPFFHPLAKHLAFLPISGTAICVLTFGFFLASLNLFDVRLHPTIASIMAQQHAPQASRQDYFNYLRNDPPFQITQRIDYSCGFREARFYRIQAECPNGRDISKLVDQHRPLITQFWRDMNLDADDVANANGAHPPFIPARYTYTQSIYLTDYVIIDFLRQFYAAENDAQKRELYKKWVDLAVKWNGFMDMTQIYNIRGRISVQFNHILGVFPALWHEIPILLPEYSGDGGENGDFLDINDLLLRSALTPIAFDRNFAGKLMREQFARFDNHLSIIRFDYFPFIQPNYTRNQFLYQADLIAAAVDNYRRDTGDESDPDDISHMTRVLNHYQDGMGVALSEMVRQSDLGKKIGLSPPLSYHIYNHGWAYTVHKYMQSFYNPLGREILIATSSQNPLRDISLSGYTLNNSLKRMILLVIYIKNQQKKGLLIAANDIDAFLRDLPDEFRYPIRGQELLYVPATISDQGNKTGPYIYHTPSGSPQTRRILVF